MASRLTTLAVSAVLVLATTKVASAQVQGVDVSEYQGTINWAAAKAAGIGFGITRVSDGTFHHDPTFRTNWNAMKAHGLVRGVYQFFRPNEDPIAQADLLINTVGTFEPGDLPPVADVEVTDGASGATIGAHLRTWCDHVKARTGLTPIIYTSPGFWNPLGVNLGNETLWVAHWFVNSPQIPRGWSNYTFWQYSDNGSVPGIPARVDRDVFHGSLSQLIAYSRGGPRPGGGGTTGHPVLSYGSTGPAVLEVQQILARDGYYHGSVDGHFGPITEAAVKAFQRAHGLTADGVVGPLTWAALLASHPRSPGPPPPAPPASHPTLMEGDTGAAVQELQRDLIKKGVNPGAVDGNFGPQTKAAVIVFQRKNGLAQDGIVGPLTWAALTK